MIRPEHLRVDLRFFDQWGDAVRDDKVVDPPADVLVPRVEPVAPPGIGVGLVWIKIAERIGETGGEQVAEFAALLVGKAGVAAVGLRVLEVDLLVRDVEVA